MTLEESVRRFLDILDKRREIMNIIEQNHIHTQNDRLVFNRYKNADNENTLGNIFAKELRRVKTGIRH